MKRTAIAAATALALAAPLAAEAGSSQAAGAPNLPAAHVAAFSNSVQQSLAQRGANVAIVARVGRDPADLPKGIKFTHVAFWVLSDVTKPDGTTHRAYRAWNLYQRSDNPGISDLIQDNPADFFAGAQRLRAGVVIPRPELQQRILKTLLSADYARLHNRRYSVLANPNNNVFQNCTEHMLNVLMAALYDTNNIDQIKANTKAHFKAQRVPLSPLERTFGPTFVPGVEVSDHQGAIRTATFSTINAFMAKHNLTDSVYTLRHFSDH